MKKTILLFFFLIISSILSGQSNYNLGYAEYINEHYKEAISLFTKAIEKKEKTFDSYLYRGMSYLYLEDIKNSKEDFDKVLKLDPKNRRIYSFYATYYSSLADFGKALEYYNIAIERDPLDYDLYSERGGVKAELGMYNEALADANISVEKQPKNFSNYLNRGYIKMRMDNYSEAIEDFNTSLSLKESQKGFGNRGAAFALLKQYDAALKDLERSLQYNSDDPTVLYIRGEVLLAMGQQENACKSFLKSRQFGNTGIDDVISQAKCTELKN
ncbi:hypothetical protein A1704_04325 [Chryseobacterium cucumeris]|uniref:tetratricopeptide repeat protein n=1 Tax=Chryseobacterium cucumeris TaxID=1813611 RepID=UPI000787283A|nr:tetratricopeptide repeat protein [Chryseobacterium cucumeris]KYH07899.1 hypothetical protein A1704_04325 [Chryseobacterium cucumeris]